jgi:hypothetical protein
MSKRTLIIGYRPTIKKRIPLSVSAENVNWNLITLFRRRFKTLWENYKDLDPEPFVGTFKQATDGRYQGTFNLPPEHRLKSFYVDFRHFYLNNEPTNIYKFASYLSSLTESNDYHQFIKSEKKNLRSVFIEEGWFKFKGKPFTSREIIDIWFNAELFHSDLRKSRTLLGWLDVLSKDTAKSMLFLAVYHSIPAIGNINWSAMELSENNLYLRLPKNPSYRKFPSMEAP